MKFDGHTSKEWLESAAMWQKKAEQYGPDMESSRKACLEEVRVCKLLAESARWHVGSVGRGKAAKLYLYEDDFQVALIKLEYGVYKIAKWFTSRPEPRFDSFCDCLSRNETIGILVRNAGL